MAEVQFDGVGTPVIDPNIKGAEVNLFSGLVIFTNSTNPREVEYEGVGVPVADGNRPSTNPQHFDNKGKNVVLGAMGASFPSDQVIFDGVGVPVAAGSIPSIVNHFDNRGKNVSYGATAAIFPGVSDLGPEGVGAPVGDGNRPDYPVSGFDNKSKNVVVTTNAGPPVGTKLWKEVTFQGATINIGD